MQPQENTNLENKEAAAKVAEENKAAAESTTEGNATTNGETISQEDVNASTVAGGEATDEPKEKPDTYKVNGTAAA